MHGWQRRSIPPHVLSSVPYCSGSCHFPSARQKPKCLAPSYPSLSTTVKPPLRSHAAAPRLLPGRLRVALFPGKTYPPPPPLLARPPRLTPSCSPSTCTVRRPSRRRQERSLQSERHRRDLAREGPPGLGGRCGSRNSGGSGGEGRRGLGVCGAVSFGKGGREGRKEGGRNKLAGLVEGRIDMRLGSFINSSRFILALPPSFPPSPPAFPQEHCRTRSIRRCPREGHQCHVPQEPARPRFGALLQNHQPQVRPFPFLLPPSLPPSVPPSLLPSFRSGNSVTSSFLSFSLPFLLFLPNPLRELAHRESRVGMLADSLTLAQRMLHQATGSKRYGKREGGREGGRKATC